MSAEKERDSWGSKLGFVLAAAGSAVGLGNIWRFPYVTGQNGGAAFVLLYIVFVLMIGIPVMIAEIALGRHTRHSPVGAFRTLAPRGGWFLIGLLGVLTGIGILSYYSVVAGWTLGYFFKTLSGAFSSPTFSSQEAQLIFERFVADPFASIGYFVSFLILSAVVVMGGVSGGIERAVKMMMPMLLVLLLLLTIRSLTLEGAAAGLNFYLKPDFSKLTPAAVAMALGQALFSLSLGMGAMITYGSYLHKKENIVSSAAYVCLFDTMIAVLAGFLIFPALFAMKIDPAQGPGLVFVVLPTIFPRMIFGIVFGAAFFLLLAIAALTSTISLLEVAVAYMVDEHKWRRKSAVISMTLLTFFLGLPSALSLGAVRGLSSLPRLGIGFLDLMNIAMGNYSLTLGALLVSLFVGYKWGVAAAFQEVGAEDNAFPYRRIWAFLIRFICPIAILVIFLYILTSRNYF